MKHKRDDGPEKQEDEAVDVTPAMICVFVVMCCCVLVLLYFFYDQLGAPAIPRPASCPPHPAALLRPHPTPSAVPLSGALGAGRVPLPPSLPPRPAPQSSASLGSSAWPPPPASTAACHPGCRDCRSARAGEPQMQLPRTSTSVLPTLPWSPALCQGPGPVE